MKDILIEQLDNESDPPESPEKESEIDDEPSHLDERTEIPVARINEITPKMNSIMYGGTPSSKHFDKHEVLLFENMFKTFRKVSS